LTLIDFDLCALGDPAIDVANFTAHLYFLGLESLGNWEALAREADLFMAFYARFHPVDDTFQQRYAFYQAATFFRLMKVVARRPGWEHHFDALCHHTTGCLETA
jgi:aminoglycoside phosphotransferase (APT) family kinase protein